MIYSVECYKLTIVIHERGKRITYLINYILWKYVDLEDMKLTENFMEIHNTSKQKENTTREMSKKMRVILF